MAAWLSIVQGARSGGARRIVALDRFDSKLEMARRVGATHVVNTSKDDPVEAVRALTGGAGVDHAFEAVGNTTLVRQAVGRLDDINEAFRAMKAGEVARTVLTFD